MTNPSRRSFLRSALAVPVALLAPLGWLAGRKASGITAEEWNAGLVAFRAQWGSTTRFTVSLGSNHQLVVTASGEIAKDIKVGDCGAHIDGPSDASLLALIPAVPPGFKRVSLVATEAVASRPGTIWNQTIYWHIVDEEIVYS